MPSSANSGKLTLGVEGEIAGTNIVLTAQEWFDQDASMNFVAAFTTDPSNATVKVGAVDQVTNATANNFASPLTYTVTSGNTTTTYTVKFRRPQNSGLPMLKVVTEGGAGIPDKINYVPGTVEIVNPANPAHNAQHDMGIRLRGNITMGWEKKPYRIKLNSKASVLGYPAEKSWVLLANYSDPTLLMNSVAFKLGAMFGLPYTNTGSPVELFLNGEYKGSYLLTQQVEVSSVRIAISKTDDFLLELDDYFDEDWRFRSSGYDLPVNIKAPDYSDPADAVIKAAFTKLENAMKANDFSYNKVKDLIDIPSLIDYIMVYEITQNTELKWPKSMYMRYIASEQKFYMGPIWDFDSGFGYEDMFKYWTGATSIHFFKAGNTGAGPGSKFINRFFDDGTFRTQYKARWNAMKGQAGSITTFIDQQAALLANSASMNCSRWSRYLGHAVSPAGNYEAIPYDLGYKAQIKSMKDFLTARITSLDTKINAW